MTASAPHRDLARDAIRDAVAAALSGDPATASEPFADPGLLVGLLATAGEDETLFRTLVETTTAFLPAMATTAVGLVLGRRSGETSPAASAAEALRAAVTAPGTPWAGHVPGPDIDFAVATACGLPAPGSPTQRTPDGYLAVIATCLNSVRTPGFVWLDCFTDEWNRTIAGVYGDHVDVHLANAARAVGARRVVDRHRDLCDAISERGDVLAFRHALTVEETREPAFGEVFSYLSSTLGTTSVARIGGGANTLAATLTAHDGPLAGAPSEAILMTLAYLARSVVTPGVPVDVFLAAVVMKDLGWDQPGFPVRHETACREALGRLGVPLDRAA